MNDVVLLLMPYAAVERPSIALGILKAGLNQAGISSKVVYANLRFAEEIGVYTYDPISKSPSHELAAEWTFSGAAFPEFDSSHPAYFEYARQSLMSLAALGLRPNAAQALQRVRAGAPAYIERVAREVIAMKPRIVGCSSTFQQQCASLAVLRRIRELAPGIVTMLGGPNCECSMGVVTHREFPWVDFVVSGEADALFAPLCRRILEEGRDLPARDWPSGVFGPSHRREPDAYHAPGEEPPRARLMDINDSPTPDYDDYFEALYGSPFADMVTPGLLLETSRGCWWGAKSHCTFCGLNGDSMSFRSKSPEKAMSEFRQLAERYGIRRFEVVDNILDMAYLNTVIPALARLDPPCEVFYETKANLKREHLEKLLAAGVEWIQPGIENMDDGVLKLIGKGTTAAINIQLLKWARELGVHIMWIFLYDLPGEDPATYGKLMEWLPWISHLQPPGSLTYIQYNRFSPYHSRPADFRLTLSAEKSYSFVYPLSPANLEDVAYYFDDYTDPSHQVIRRFDEAQRPAAINELHRCFYSWREQWIRAFYPDRPGPEPATLIGDDDGETLTITDTRRCAVARRSVFTGLARQVYRVCDRPLTPPLILKALEKDYGVTTDWTAIQPVIAEFQRLRMIVNLNDHWLNLAVRSPVRPVPSAARFPGGQIESAYERQQREKLRKLAQEQGALQAELLFG